MYILTIQPINSNANAVYFNYWVKDNYNIISIEHNSLAILVSFIEEPIQSTKDAIIDKYNSLTLLDVLISDEIIQEIKFKEQREEYGRDIYNLTASMARINRQSLPSLPENEHEQYRINHYDPLKSIVTHILHGDFKSAYEEINIFTATEFITPTTLISYRFIVAQYIISNSAYTDIFGSRVNGGTYSENFNDTLDAQGFIISS
jgi:hypothetical protein